MSGFKFEYLDEESETGKPKFTRLQDGKVKFEIIDILTKDKMGYGFVNSSGNSYIRFVLKCRDKSGNSNTVNENISTKQAWKLIQIGKAIGRKINNKTGEYPWASLIQMRGECVIASTTNPKFPHESKYEFNTNVTEYVPIPESQQQIEKEVDNSYLDEEIPF